MKEREAGRAEKKRLWHSFLYADVTYWIIDPSRSGFWQGATLDFEIARPFATASRFLILIQKGGRSQRGLNIGEANIFPLVRYFIRDILPRSLFLSFSLSLSFSFAVSLSALTSSFSHFFLIFLSRLFSISSLDCNPFSSILFFTLFFSYVLSYYLSYSLIVLYPRTITFFTILPLFLYAFLPIVTVITASLAFYHVFFRLFLLPFFHFLLSHFFRDCYYSFISLFLFSFFFVNLSFTDSLRCLSFYLKSFFFLLFPKFLQQFFIVCFLLLSFAFIAFSLDSCHYSFTLASFSL